VEGIRWVLEGYAIAYVGADAAAAGAVLGQKPPIPGERTSDFEGWEGRQNGLEHELPSPMRNPMRKSGFGKKLRFH